jgi:hypothetical protein
MQNIVYCHHCEKSYPTTPEDIHRIQCFDPEHLIVSGNVYSYSGGCYFKTLAQLKRLERQTQHDKGTQQ